MIRSKLVVGSLIAAVMSYTASASLKAQDDKRAPESIPLIDSSKINQDGLPSAVEAETMAKAIMEIREQIGPITDWSLLTDQPAEDGSSPQPPCSGSSSADSSCPAASCAGAKAAAGAAQCTCEQRESPDERAAVIRAMARLSRDSAVAIKPAHRESPLNDPSPLHRQIHASTMAAPVRLVSSLRQAARQLDELSADFEDLNEYQLADRFGQQARKLREMARHRQTAQLPPQPNDARWLPEFRPHADAAQIGGQLPPMPNNAAKRLSRSPRFRGIDSPPDRRW